jgi:hypothetical protein
MILKNHTPRGMIFDKHSDLIDRTNRSAYAFKFGLRTGSLTAPVAEEEHARGPSDRTRACGRIISLPEVGGLRHRYERLAA